MAVSGTIVWNELTTSDLEASKAFYATTLGWTYEEITTPAGPYTLARRPDQTRPVAGLIAWPPEENGADQWFAYVAVADIDATLATVEAAGGKAQPVFEVPDVGRFATVADTTGATFGLMQRHARG